MYEQELFFVCNEISVLGTLYFKQIAAVYRPHSTQHAEAVAAFGQHVGLQQACNSGEHVTSVRGRRFCMIYPLLISVSHARTICQ